MTKTLPDFSFEKDLWNRGVKFIGGIDEVGRGAFAGPVMAGCVIFRENQTIDCLINDSKKMSAKDRQTADLWIKANSVSWGVGSATASQIDKFGIVKATQIAMRKAIKNCELNINYLLLDAFYLPHAKGLRRKKQLAIVKGDGKSLSIAAASIIAKVERDAFMCKLNTNPKYKKYGWDTNKGYGTKYHRDVIKSVGKTRLHRVSFLFKLS